MEVHSLKLDQDAVIYSAAIKALADFKPEIDVDFSKLSNQAEAQILAQATTEQFTVIFQKLLEQGYAKAISKGQLAEWGAYYMAHKVHNK
ncbi:hypothetical protein C5Z26_08760 [Lactobacillus sp. CBA3606]|uniref:hypothetical protein n=1 Tax=unclassified Lactobacillus TaxID=2620435 RepID=UPI000CFE15CD|nr:MULTISPECIES: hypothetical protein [unclassified Lactobacillus]AVK61625.1 hypothetical protein C5Z25_07485 [Lactobacillus sp. CBA3605]AVK64196.1 hypothetical protein C5Z26_08760 [Lactobacillus sp. CBA3606]